MFPNFKWPGVAQHRRDTEEGRFQMGLRKEEGLGERKGRAFQAEGTAWAKARRPESRTELQESQGQGPRTQAKAGVLRSALIRAAGLSCKGSGVW